ncbi:MULTISPECIES: NUDIX hydrolase [unclassified Brevundimonas]|uniref:NUDIX hydrolase n=1 Tax=unclassified Brevundimonas TaxID=2622653 RepID=UPI0025C284C9|nr:MULTISPECIES: NUDIX hydrolase [unclassified Brevundimonas]
MTPVPAVGVVCLKGDQVLLIRRGQPPRVGEWSLPGGRIEPGERTIDAALRELSEETGVTARIGGLLDVVDGIFSEAARHYVLIDYWAEWLSGDVVAGDDAADARFFDLDQALDMVEWDETRRIIRAAYSAKSDKNVE